MSDKRKYDGKYWFDDALMALLVKLANSTTSLVFATFGVIIFFGLMYSFTEEDKGSQLLKFLV